MKERERKIKKICLTPSSYHTILCSPFTTGNLRSMVYSCSLHHTFILIVSHSALLCKLVVHSLQIHCSTLSSVLICSIINIWHTLLVSLMVLAIPFQSLLLMYPCAVTQGFILRTWLPSLSSLHRWSLLLSWLCTGVSQIFISSLVPFSHLQTLIIYSMPVHLPVSI
jgi:hypothetical protein